MPCTITYAVDNLDGTPRAGYVTWAEPVITPYEELVGGVWTLIGAGKRTAPLNALGHGSITLPDQAETRPANQQWILHLTPDIAYRGAIAAGLTGSHDLLTYWVPVEGWRPVPPS